MKRVLLTGASGFVGSHVLRHILANTDWEVVCLVSFHHRGLTDRIRLAVAGYDDEFERVTVLRHDLTAPISIVLADNIGPIDYIINVASESHVDRSIESPAPFIANNVALMTTMLDYARMMDIEAFLHVSTDEVYGPAPEGHAHLEWLDVHLPSNPYSASKSAQESIAYSYWRTYDVPLIITNCWDMDTRLFTQDGPKRYDEVSEGDLIWSLDDEENLVLQPVLEKVRMASSGTMVKIDGHAEQFVTPNHRMMIRRSVGNPRRWGTIEETHAQNLVDMSGRVAIPRTGNWNGNNADEVETPFGVMSSEWVAQICGWYITEGCVSGSTVSIGAATEPQYREIERLLDGFGNVYRNGRSVRVANRALADWLVSMCGKGSYEKRINPAIREMSPKYLSAFLDAAIAGDGTRYGDGAVIYTVSESLAYDYAEIGMKCGYAAHVSQRVTKSYRSGDDVHSFITRLSPRRNSYIESRNVSEVPYDGDVWCVRVPNGRVFTERSGKISFTGQTMNIIGEMQDPEKFVPMVIRRVLLEQEVPIHASADGDVIGSRFYLHARNQADGLLFALTQPVPSWREADVPAKWHIVGEREVDNLEMAAMVAEFVGKPLKYDLVDFHSSRPGHDLRYALDGGKMRAAGWSAPYSLEESLRRTVEWTLKRPEWLDL